MRLNAIAVMMVVAALLGVATGAAAQDAKQDTVTITLKVTGMTCGGCATAVKMAAKKVAGVTDATVSYEKGQAVVTYNPAKTNPAAIAKAITESSGFKAEVTKSAPAAEMTRAALKVDGLPRRGKHL